MKSIIFLYLLGTFLAGAIAVIVSFLFPVNIRLTEGAEQLAAPGNTVEVLQKLVLNMVDNPVNALIQANYIGILTWAIVLGIALKMRPIRRRHLSRIFLTPLRKWSDGSSNLLLLVSWESSLALLRKTVFLHCSITGIYYWY